MQSYIAEYKFSDQTKRVSAESFDDAVDKAAEKFDTPRSDLITLTRDDNNDLTIRIWDEAEIAVEPRDEHGYKANVGELELDKVDEAVLFGMAPERGHGRFHHSNATVRTLSSQEDDWAYVEVAESVNQLQRTQG